MFITDNCTCMFTYTGCFESFRHDLSTCEKDVGKYSKTGDLVLAAMRISSRLWVSDFRIKGEDFLETSATFFGPFDELWSPSLLSNLGFPLEMVSCPITYTHDHFSYLYIFD